jgi:hypothetical protein
VPADQRLIFLLVPVAGGGVTTSAPAAYLLSTQLERLYPGALVLFSPEDRYEVQRRKSGIPYATNFFLPVRDPAPLFTMRP